MGRERAHTVAPLTELTAVQSEIETTHQARDAAAAFGPPPLESIPDVRSVLDRARTPGSVLDGPEFALIVPVLDASPRLSAWGRGVRPCAPELARITDTLPRVQDLREELTRAIDDDGAVRDRATPTLARLRREIRERRQRIVAELERMLAGSEADRLFAERYVTVRHGRYVLPVRVEARSRVPGIVHDRSQSGQTLFVEPARLVEANNDLVQTLREEEQETARVLAQLSAAVHARLDDLDRLIETIATVDWIFARAHLADRMEATAPTIDREGSVSLRGARHPLLLAQTWAHRDRTVVPVDLELGRDRPLLLVTGPNAGGKTVALKTLGLLVLMAQIGCHVPAAEGSRLPVFERLYTVVGDDQSVAENLSTFSAFVKQIREILDTVNEHSLVLLDELGAGTDPDEGAALAQAILEELETRGALVMATTHLEPLKAFASTHLRARNASVEFDTETLGPTFRLRYDVPGQSYALTIAGKLGLAPGIIARANGHRTAHAQRLGELLTRLDAHRRNEAERAKEIDDARSEAAARLAAARETETAAERRARALVDRARADAEALVGDIRRAISTEWERLRRADRSRQSLEESRRRVGEAAARIERRLPAAPAGPPPMLTPGMRVAAEHLGVRGEVVAVTGTTATVRTGTLTIRVPVQALREDQSAASAAPTTVAGLGITVPAKAGVAAELHLLGRTTDETRDLVEQYLDDAFLAGLPVVRLVHGKGSGALRRAVRELLEGHPLVASFRDGEPSEGGSGATVAALNVS